MKKTTVLSVLLCVLTSWSLAQQAMNFRALKSDTQIFERVVAERLTQAFSDPFALKDAPQASYLQGYGVVVGFRLSITRGTVRTPFGEVTPEGTEAGETKQERIARLEDVIVRSLADFAGAIKQLSAHDQISISAHIEDRSELDPARRSSVLVVTTTRDNVDLLRMGRIQEGEFRERLHFLRY